MCKEYQSDRLVYTAFSAPRGQRPELLGVFSNWVDAASCPRVTYWVASVLRDQPIQDDRPPRALGGLTIQYRAKWKYRSGEITTETRDHLVSEWDRQPDVYMSNDIMFSADPEDRLDLGDAIVEAMGYDEELVRQALDFHVERLRSRIDKQIKREK